MTSTDLSTRIKLRVHPEPYDVDISPSGNFDFILKSKAIFANGKYAVGFKQISAPIDYDQFLEIRSEAQKLTKSRWLFREVGLYLIICGKENFWSDQQEMIVADKTGLHSIIINAVHFVDPDTGKTHLTTSSWGSVEFGDVNLISKVIEEELKQPQQAG